MESSRKEIKTFLSEYLYLIAEEKTTVEEINQLRSRLDIKSPTLSDMPRSAKAYNVEDYIADADELIDYLNTLKIRQISAYKEIRKLIDNVKPSVKRQILVKRYLLGDDLNTIADDLGYAYPYMRRLHGEALDEIVLPKDVTPSDITS